MAGAASGERLASEAVDGQRGSIAVELAASARHQALADSDQALADADQTASDSDQTNADRDQAAADADQAASDRSLATGGDEVAHDLSRDVRARSAALRDQTAAQRRVETANARDAVAQARDQAAAARDEAGALHDRELAERDAAWAALGHRVTRAELLVRAGEYRKLAAAARLAAFEARTRAAADREQAARDRRQAASDRRQAQLDRDALLRQLSIAETDELTGVRTRSAGLATFAIEVDRARRTDGRLAVAYVDVVGLKAVNDAHGHAAGDALLRHVVDGMRAHLRSYDLIVRMGGDEFLCVLPGATIPATSERFATIQAALMADHEPSQIRVGIAALASEDTATELIARADAELP